MHALMCADMCACVCVVNMCVYLYDMLVWDVSYAFLNKGCCEN